MNFLSGIDLIKNQQKPPLINAEIAKHTVIDIQTDEILQTMTMSMPAFGRQFVSYGLWDEGI